MSTKTDFDVPVKAILNNLIELDNGEKVAGVKIIPRNIFILEENDQFSILSRLKDMYNTFDFEFWLVVTDRPVDIAVHIAQLQAQFNQSQSSLARKLISQDLQKANQFINEGVSDVEFYFLFKEKNIEIIQKRIRLMMNGLAQAGLFSSQANNDDLRVILDSFLNAGEKTEFGTVMS
ncbi:MAG: hypothetical protein MR296_02135 [Tenericutes bacterium]|nr:hypothetical protein [Mycoplasmatota bacterium]